MQVGSSAGLWPQLQALGGAALNQFQGGAFSFNVDDSDDDGASGAGSTGAGDQLSGSSKSGSLIAVGTMSASGKLTPFSAAQVQSEETMAAKMSQISFADSLQNFLTLAQAGSPSGQLAGASMTDQQSYTADNGLIAGYSD